MSRHYEHGSEICTSDRSKVAGNSIANIRNTIRVLLTHRLDIHTKVLCNLPEGTFRGRSGVRYAFWQLYMSH